MELWPDLSHRSLAVCSPGIAHVTTTLALKDILLFHHVGFFYYASYASAVNAVFVCLCLSVCHKVEFY